ncbi:tyrosine-protein kinase JAK2 isoform X2 [Tetranychus urticae]|uniref:tyrosine-protein kinase JAK2 isoform X2 n=1 Tax=Tetranychus urticae TaxID=32264 RepID=UPI00077BEDBC|nr:tyrosine-protein kinase JAK2 isoform X2 [Tetranychus urticae]
MTTMKISAFIYENGEIVEKTIERYIGTSLEYAEDLIIDICRERKIGPIAQYLFSLFCPKLNIWISSNQKLSELDYNFKSLELRIRFKPRDLRKLTKLDENAFDYYYCQIRDAFRNSRIEDTGQLFGLVITDLLIYLLERKIPVENALSHIKSLRDFVPIPYKAESKFLKDLKGPQILQNLAMASHAASNNDGLGKSKFVKKEFITEIVNYDKTIIKDLGYETFTIYKSRFEKINGLQGTNEFLLQIRPFQSIDIFTAQKSNTPDWVFFCSIEDICFIIVQNLGVEISRKNGTPVFLTVANQMVMKSLLSLLEGYHRLTTGDSICICEYVMPPSIQQFKEIRCHGPISSNDSLSIFIDKDQCTIGNYLIRHDQKRYEYVIDVWIGNSGIKSFQIVKKMSKLLVLDQDQLIATFSSFDALKKELKVSSDTNKSIDLKLCIPPLGTNIFAWGILCGNQVKQEKLESPEIITVQLKFSNYLTKETRMESFKDKSFRYYLIDFKDDKLLCKVPSTDQTLSKFLRQLNSWSSLTSDLVTRTKFISICPPAFIRNYYPLGPLDEYLRRNHSEIKTYELIECAMYLTRALCYLHENAITHGMIRCRALLLVERSNSRFQIILGDPFIHLDENEDRLWIPKEYSANSESIPLSVDIFACATTLWEIFSLGQRPPGTDVYNLSRPLSCPSPIWQLIHKCWQPDPEQRKHPMEMHRDIRELFLREYQIRNYSSTSEYAYIEENKHKKRSSLAKLFNKLTTNYRVSSEYDYRLEDDENSVDYDYDSDLPWVIPVSHLQISTFNGREAILGSGAYGEVLKARYPADSDNFVAVKRITRRAKQRNGERIITDVEREFQIMTRVFHPNIVSIIGIVKDPEIMLVMEFMELGSLSKFLRKLEPAEIKSIPFKKYALDIVSGMEYLEKVRIVHRDLAARNILMASTNKVKISDFGLAQSLGPGEDIYFVKTPRYLPFKWYAPESIKQDPIFTHKSDVWSFGITLWELFSVGEVPDYPVANKNSIVDLIKFLEGGGTLPKPDKEVPDTDKFWQIMLNCWKIDETDRPNFSQLRNEIDEICKDI